MRIPQWFVFFWVVLIAATAIGASLLTYGFVRDRASELDRVLRLPDPPQLNRPAATKVADVVPTPTAASSPAEVTTAGTPATPQASAQASEPGTGQPTAVAAADAGWTDPRRVSILLMGIDQRAGETGTFPTDTIIVLSLDPVGNTAAILSVPRDLWVEYPGLNRSGRINAANIVGDEINYPGGGGPMFALKTVEKVLGIKIQYYVLINFEVFYRLIDAVGPIEVCPKEAIDDNKYPDGSYGYITVHFDPGCQPLDSQRLLQYARVRHNDSDIGRSARQQEVILNVRKKVLTMGGITALLPEVPALWNSVQSNVRTNLSLEDMVKLGRSAEQVPAENIRQGQITFSEVFISQTPDGDQILVPIGTDIRMLVEDLFRPAGTPSTRQQP